MRFPCATARRHSCSVFCGQFGRGGRFPATKSNNNGLLHELCSTWRGGSTPLRDHFRGDADSALRLLVTSREPHLAEAHTLEVSAASPGALHLDGGVYVARAAQLQKLARMTSLRCELDVLAFAHTPEELVDKVSALNWRADTRASETAWELHCERRHDAGSVHIPSPQMRNMLAHACGHQLRIARGNAEPSVIRFACIEAPAGYFFGAVTYAPSSSAAVDDAWIKKPHNYGAGMTLPLARLGTNLATGLDYENARIVDPCCGSGTVLFAAWCQGAAGVGGTELQPAVALQCRANLAALRTQALAERRRVAEEAAGSAVDSLPEVEVFTADAMHAVFRRSAPELVTLDASLGPDPVDCIVSNLPFGRWVGVGGRQSHARLKDTHADALPRLLTWLRPQAERHAYFYGEQGLGELLCDLGFGNINELHVDKYEGKRWLTLANM